MRTIKTDISENALDAAKSTISIRPNYLNEYIGQENIKKNLQTAIRYIAWTYAFFWPARIRKNYHFRNYSE